ncbi:uncharacterized protein [Clytia hemisphaerica]|uniref:Snake toxin/toxin-like domain-containing protein n=1 Tax=Clytia hemisphaerica TaxID=252671 RepID=A0A7M5V2I7_9CNID
MDLHLVLSVLLFCIYVHYTESKLNCWRCEADKKWEDCDNWTSTTCQGDQTLCGYFYSKQGTVETFMRDCVTEDFCNNKPPCKDKKLSSCKIKCCDKDLCNEEMVPEFVDEEPKATEL